MFADIIGTDRGLSMYGLDGASGSFLLIAAIGVALLFGSLLVFSLNHWSGSLPSRGRAFMRSALAMRQVGYATHCLQLAKLTADRETRAIL
jgi:hypothetical protein